MDMNDARSNGPDPEFLRFCAARLVYLGDQEEQDHIKRLLDIANELDGEVAV